MARFYADEQFPRQIVEALQALGQQEGTRSPEAGDFNSLVRTSIILPLMTSKPQRSPLMRLRVQRFLPQQQLADALGVTETTVRNSPMEEISENAGVLVYRVTARREGSARYVALISSTKVEVSSKVRYYTVYILSLKPQSAYSSRLNEQTMNYQRIEEILQNNRLWAAQQQQIEPNYFKALSAGQTPPYLYIGCSDSRLPLTRFMQVEPGEVFVHRNIANQVCLTDINFLSVLEYAVNHLNVQHVIVCGHYSCGGIQAALEGSTAGLVDTWVNPIRELYLQKREEIDMLPSREAKMNHLAELNVAAQVKNLYQTSIIRNALREGHAPQVHGWVLELHSGLIKNLDISTEGWHFQPSCPVPQSLLLGF